jgi:hemerythrin
MNFYWDDKYNFDIDEIDCQHKKFFEIADELNNLVLANDNYDKFDEISAIYIELQKYAIYHFETEEQLMVKTSYPNYQEHKKEHDDFADKILSFYLDSFDQDKNNALKELLDFVYKWIISHMFNSDMKYIVHFENHGIV